MDEFSSTFLKERRGSFLWYITATRLDRNEQDLQCFNQRLIPHYTQGGPKNCTITAFLMCFQNVSSKIKFLYLLWIIVSIMSQFCYNFCNFYWQLITIRRRRFISVEQLKRAIITEWSKLSQCFTDRAINEWRHRLECVVQQQGGHIEHCFVMNNYVPFLCVWHWLFIYLFASIFIVQFFGPPSSLVSH